MPQDTNTASAYSDTSRLIEAYGLSWNRGDVIWKGTPKLLGYQEDGESVDFCNRQGVYILYNNDKVVYVGRSTEQGIGIRLKEHNDDGSKDPWDRFSWFVTHNATGLEAVLIEVMAPPENRKQGDGMKGKKCKQMRLGPLFSRQDGDK